MGFGHGWISLSAGAVCQRRGCRATLGRSEDCLWERSVCFCEA
ncbi:hypothetical protein GRAN_1227 [Granulicella sibirica]|uniref:Uncharacterized protein n=1 Tax=Granulicella sibirica TaxID=2479048 RepID=A0A4Q0T3P4_9BACT|nr:hypothetical protein GRAN_1227 [Granulicella sibirica]